MSAPRYRSIAFIHPDFDAGAGVPGLRLTPAGRLGVVTDAASVRQALLLLLSTRPGERINRPTYGCHLFRLVFAPADDTTAGLAIHYVARAVEQWEPRINVLSLDAGRSPETPELLEVRLRYRVRTTQLEDEIAIAVPVASGGAP
ncbi:GPW/gp25 family protein [Arthrobacter sp. CDRTa11]|jgi:phage baseplate assembly protein W|uniref:GPW/gp25 family protein n=1 Tax=Arthrobacter sp. CDRTa11 TaxID=2651199 RepID=UPI002265F1FA|nr:GPW/gp25 family protein [Arthrobacter sp. CDRTa11]UZX04930.1 GPW/gp25 family protein [Arthrobacter sp. CDRTa11]